MKRLVRKILKLPEKLPVSPPAKKAAAPAHEVALRHAESLRLKTAKLNPDTSRGHRVGAPSQQRPAPRGGMGEVAEADMSAKTAEVRRPRPKRQASAAPEPVDAGPKKTRKTLLRERRRADAADSPLGAEQDFNAAQLAGRRRRSLSHASADLRQARRARGGRRPRAGAFRAADLCKTLD